MSGRLKLRRGVVVGEEPLTVEVDGERRPAWADTNLLGEMREGDEVIVNVAALDLGLGSGGFDVVHVNLTRGLDASGESDEHVMKLNYTSLQHPVEPVEPSACETHRTGGKYRWERVGASMPVLVLPLHGHLAPAAWAAAQAPPPQPQHVFHPWDGKRVGELGFRVGYVQTGGGALPGSLSRDVAELRQRGLLCDHITAAPAYGGEREALSVAGALDAAANSLGWDAALVGPGPGIIGSDTRLGHGGLAALDSAHAALALGLPTLLSPRLSEADSRERHRGLSHHTLTVLELLLGGVGVVVPSGNSQAAAQLADATGGRHRLHEAQPDVAGYASSGLSARTMGRGLDEDRLFFEAALAAGTHLARART
ncbi:MAG TPA: DUF3866 family protein [Solirubrobacterales bacterium]|nr:DUF3866 family protein [Solirubrobacterales bacterium]